MTQERIQPHPLLGLAIGDALGKPDGMLTFDEDELRPVVPPFRVYLAGTGHDPEIADQRIPGFIKATGHELVSTWHEPGHWVPETTELRDDAWDAIAEKNLWELAKAERSSSRFRRSLTTFAALTSSAESRSPGVSRSSCGDSPVISIRWCRATAACSRPPGRR